MAGRSNAIWPAQIIEDSIGASEEATGIVPGPTSREMRAVSRTDMLAIHLQFARCVSFGDYEDRKALAHFCILCNGLIIVAGLFNTL